MKLQPIIFLLFYFNSIAQFSFNVKNYNPSTGFPNSCVHHISSDRANNLFFSTELGICKFDGRSFSKLEYRDGLKENIITQSKKVGDTIWYLAYRKGLFNITTNKQTFSLHQSNVNCHRFLFHKNQIATLEFDSLMIYQKNQTNYTRVFSYTNSWPLTIQAWKNNYYFLSRKNLFKIDDSKLTIRPILDSGNYLYSYQKNNLIYIARQGELIVFDTETDKIISSIKNPLIENITMLFVDGTNTIWLSSTDKNNLFILKEQTLYNMNYLFKSNVPQITCFFQDFHQNIWIATYGSGIFKLSENNLFQLNSDNGLNDNYVNCLGRVNNQLYIGTTHGLYKHDYTTHQTEWVIKSKEGTLPCFIYGITPISNSQALINHSTPDELLVQNSKTNTNLRFSNYRCAEKLNDSIFILAGHTGNIAFLNTITKKIFNKQVLNGIVLATRSHSIKLHTKNSVLLASDMGLHIIYFTPDYKISKHHIITSIPQQRINSIIKVGTYFYVGGLNVLARLDENLNPTFITELAGTNFSEVKSFAYSSKKDLLFIASLNGLFKLDLRTREEGKILIDNNFTSLETNCLLFDDIKNQLIAGTCNGVDIYNEALFDPKINQELSIPEINQVIIGHDTLTPHPNQQIEIPSLIKQIEFNVSMANFEHSNLLKFKFYLKSNQGFEKIIDGNVFVMGDIPYGESELYVTSTFDSKIFSKPYVLKLNKLKPWYLSKIGIAIITFLLITLLSLIIFVIVKQYKKREIKKLAEQANLNKLTLMAYNRTMSPHFVFNVLSNIQGLINTNEVELANDYLVNFSKLLRRSIDIIQKDTISITEEIDFIEKYIILEKLRLNKSIETTLVNKIDKHLESQIFIPPMLVQPLIENSFKYGIAGANQNLKIHIEFSIIDDNLIIEVNNNGTNFKEYTEEKKEGSFGLKSVRERLKNFDGVFTITNLEQGVSNKISIPLKKLNLTA